jgi:hypothetical protein
MKDKIGETRTKHICPDPAKDQGLTIEMAAWTVQRTATWYFSNASQKACSSLVQDHRQEMRLR